MTGYETFCLYHSLKLHFTTENYNYFKYSGKSKITVEAFERRKDKYNFYKLSRKYDRQEDMLLFLVSNFVEKEDIWVGDLLEENALINYKNHEKILHSLSYIFENECELLFNFVNNPNDILTTNGEYPILLTRALRKEISIETLCILNKILNFLPMWNNKITDTIRYPLYHRKIIKYSDFLDLNITKFKLILKKLM